MFKNLINGKRYIGSSEHLNRRFTEYFNTNYLLKHNDMAICCALLKHGYSNFSITILEYCEPSKCLIREKHYWDILNSEYNIAKDPTCSYVWSTHSEKTKIKISEGNKGKTHSEKTKKNNVTFLRRDAKK